MSDVNKLDSTTCSFNPDQYKYKKSIDIEVNDVAPMGSFPWAVIQVYLNKPVRRSDWDSNIYLMPKYDDSGSVITLQWLDKDGNILPWTPKQEDMLACDWELVKIKPKPAECMLSFDLEIGVSKENNPNQYWGYVTAKSEMSPEIFGTLTNFQSTIDVGSVLAFLCTVTMGDFTDISLIVDTQNLLDLPSRNLEVTVDCATYHLGSSVNPTTTGFSYYLQDSRKLGDLLKQNVGNTLHFCFNWK
ncbi:Thoeris anti-defense Tad2 family protein [Xenorhabdus stockiae]|uniref:Thoeris anti-defense Tad2 family protein n=1 Tax=Xenorhabdus stockiae TaxID=351614 RepID=UPI003CF6B331